MKTIQPVTIWANGANKEAKLLNAYVVRLVLNSSATFYYSLMAQNEDGSAGETLAQGNLNMDGAAYASWEQDETAWDWIASSLNLTITGGVETTVENSL
jgi:hypothetical protein